MASISFSFTFVLLLSGLMVLGTIIEGTEACNLYCVQGAYITCTNYPGQKLYGCACVCKPQDGKGCVVHSSDGSTEAC